MDQVRVRPFIRVSPDRDGNVIEVHLGNTSAEKYAKHANVASRIHSRYDVKYSDREGRGREREREHGSIEWRKRVAVCHDGTMRVTSDIIRVLLAEESRFASGIRIDRGDNRREQRGGNTVDFFRMSSFAIRRRGVSSRRLRSLNDGILLRILSRYLGIYAS